MGSYYWLFEEATLPALAGAGRGCEGEGVEVVEVVFGSGEGNMVAWVSAWWRSTLVLMEMETQGEVALGAVAQEKRACMILFPSMSSSSREDRTSSSSSVLLLPAFLWTLKCRRYSMAARRMSLAAVNSSLNMIFVSHGGEMKELGMEISSVSSFRVGTSVMSIPPPRSGACGGRGERELRSFS